MFSIRYYRSVLAGGVLLAAGIFLVSPAPAAAGHDSCTGLIEAAFLDEADDINDLFAQGVDVNCRDDDGQTPLMLAAEGGSALAVRIILAGKAEVNLRDKYGQSALDRARVKLEFLHMEGAEHIHLIYKGIVKMLKNAGAVEKLPGASEKRSKPKKAGT